MENVDKQRLKNIQEWYNRLGICHPDDIKYMIDILKDRSTH